MLHSIATKSRKRVLPSRKNQALFASFTNAIDSRYKLKNSIQNKFKYRCDLCISGRYRGYKRTKVALWGHVQTAAHLIHGEDNDLIELAILCDSSREATQASSSSSGASQLYEHNVADSSARQLGSASSTSDAASALSDCRASNNGLATVASVPPITAGESAPNTVPGSTGSVLGVGLSSV